MKKLIAIAIVAILFTGAAMAQFPSGGTNPKTAQGSFTLEAFCDFKLEPVANQSVELGDFWIPSTPTFTANEKQMIWTLTGNSTGVNGKFNVDFNEPVLSVDGGNIVLAVTYTRNYKLGTNVTDAAWTDLTGISTVAPETGGTPCTGTATFEVEANGVTILGGATPGDYSFLFSMSVTQTNL